MLSFFVYLATAVLCFYLGRREKDKQLQAVIRERDNWRLMFNTLAAEHQRFSETIDDLQRSLRIKENFLQKQDKEIASLRRTLRGQNTDKDRKQIYNDLHYLRYFIRTKARKRYSPCVRILFQKIQKHIRDLMLLQETIDKRIEQFRHLDASINYDQIFKEREQYQKELMEKSGVKEMYISWDDDKIRRFQNNAFDLQICHNYLAILFRSIDSMKGVIIPDKYKRLLSYD